ncbi:MAG: efflux RND transporter periplasmic adaptor subunit [Selenomonadaceae bacterium]|nr:efflux RND transporter periplasmic adaptor subunit [Selenomonadaceae bacterium]
MRKYFIAGIAIILALSVGTIYYGASLNQRGESHIMQRLEENQLEVPGAKAVVREIRSKIKLPAVTLHTGAMIDVVALIDGRIVSSLVSKNGLVRKGDVIFIIENEKISLQLKEAEADILKARSELKRTENNYNRHLQLREMDAVSAAKFDEAEAAYVAAQANMEAAESKRDQLIIQDSRQSVTAPIDGRIIVIYRQQGAYVSEGTSLAMVGDFSSLYFVVPMEDENARHLSIGQEVDLTFGKRAFQKAYNTEYEAGNLGSEQTFLATVQDITPPLTEHANMRNVFWQVVNTSGLLEPQTYGATSFQFRQGHRCLAVPIIALTDSKDSVFVVQSDGIIKSRAVKTGSDDGEWIEIISGLASGDIVITGGKEVLTDGMSVSVTLDSETPAEDSINK